MHFSMRIKKPNQISTKITQIFHHGASNQTTDFETYTTKIHKLKDIIFVSSVSTDVGLTSNTVPHT